jgi:hypothetical protein
MYKYILKGTGRSSVVPPSLGRGLFSGVGGSLNKPDPCSRLALVGQHGAAGLQSAAAALRSEAGVGWRAGLLSRGCGGRAFARVDGEVEGPRFPRAAARPAGDSALNLAGLLISFPIHHRMALPKATSPSPEALF